MFRLGEEIKFWDLDELVDGTIQKIKFDEEVIYEVRYGGNGFNAGYNLVDLVYSDIWKDPDVDDMAEL